MEKLKCTQQFVKDITAGWLVKVFKCHVVKEFSTSTVLHDKEEVFGCLYNFIKLYEIRMANKFEYVYLSGDSFNVRDVENVDFFKNFDYYFLPCGFSNGQFDVPEGCLCQSLL